MARYASGKKSLAISDISGLRVKYTKLRTTWDGLRVSPEDFDPKQPQLTPAKNVVDATALFNPRPDTDPENISFFVGFNYDPFLDPRQQPTVGINATSIIGTGAVGYPSFLEVKGVSGNGGTGSVGVEALDLSIDEAGVGGTGAVGTSSFFMSIDQVGAGGAGDVGTSSLLASIDEVGVGGTGAVGTEALIMEINEVGVSGNADVGDAAAEIDYGAWGYLAWGEGAWGE